MTIFQQIPRRDVPARQAEGWTIAEDLTQPTHHNVWSVLMRAPEPEQGGLQPFGEILNKLMTKAFWRHSNPDTEAGE